MYLLFKIIEAKTKIKNFYKKSILSYNHFDQFSGDHASGTRVHLGMRTFSISASSAPKNCPKLFCLTIPVRHLQSHFLIQDCFKVAFWISNID